MTALDEFPVLIVGGGPVGLSTSILCSYLGVRSLLVERHPGTTIYPKARLINARTMEIFRQVGIEDAVREVEIQSARFGAVPALRPGVVVHNLAEIAAEVEQQHFEAPIPESVQDWSPTRACVSAQDLVEPILLAQARSREPAEIRFNTELLGFEQHDDYVLARLFDRSSGREGDVRTQYLIAADGAVSGVREALAIRMLGVPVLSHFINILFRADLASAVGGREIGGAFIANPEAPGLLLSNGGNRWKFEPFYYPDQGERPEDYTPERCREIVRTALGVPDLPLELDGIFPWHDAALVAERYGDGRVFLVGDAEHLMSPAGGFGMNVGIQNAHNLTWKLAAVVQGWAGSALLATYETERAPVARAITEYSARILTAQRSASGGLPVLPRELVRAQGWVFGPAYESSAIVPDGTAPVKVPNTVTDYVPNARPGSRAPHVWLDGDGARRSTLDLFGPHFMLLAGAVGGAWCDAAQSVAQEFGLPLTTYAVGGDSIPDEPAGAWAAAYGVDADGAVLVRPDGYVAWRSPAGSKEAEPTMEAVLRGVLARDA